MQGQGANAGGGRATSRVFLSGIASLVLGVTLAACGTPPGTHTRTVSFDSGDIRLAGALVTPAEGKAQAAIVYVDGSGATRRNLGIARRLAENGIAVLTYDKRGVGDSQGEYSGPLSTNEVTLNALAADASAALEFLSAQSEVSDAKLGFAGISQAGWVIPLAAVASDKEAFTVVWSGMVGRISEEDIFSLYTSDRDGADLPGFEEIVAQRVRPYAWPPELGEDVNSVDSLAQLDKPGLWVFGGRDGSIPVALSIARLEELQRDEHAFEYVLFSSAGHDTVETSFPVVADWIKRVGAASGQAVASLTAPLETFVGNYVMDDPPVSVSVSAESKELVITSQGDSLPAVRTGDASFYMLVPGEGFYYFDFDPREDSLVMNAQGRAFTLRRTSR
jgi:dienelactone hydrolase